MVNAEGINLERSCEVMKRRLLSVALLVLALSVYGGGYQLYSESSTDVLSIGGAGVARSGAASSAWYWGGIISKVVANAGYGVTSSFATGSYCGVVANGLQQTFMSERTFLSAVGLKSLELSR